MRQGEPPRPLSIPNQKVVRGSQRKSVEFGDLPLKYRGNVETGPPFGLNPGVRPALNNDEIGDVGAFPEALTDAFVR
jgi:hypothetical protein